MKKNLLLALGVGFCFSGFAQTQLVPKKQDKTNSKFNKQDGLNFSAIGQQRPYLNFSDGGSNRAVT